MPVDVQDELGTWLIEIKGGPAFASNASMACRQAAANRTPGPSSQALLRLSGALDRAQYQAPAPEDTQVTCAGGITIPTVGAGSGE